MVTNPQGEVEWAQYAAAIRSKERQEHLEELLAASADASGVLVRRSTPPASTKASGPCTPPGTALPGAA